MVVVSNIVLSQQTQKEGHGTDAVITPWILYLCQVLSLSLSGAPFLSYSIPLQVVYVVAPANQFKASKPIADQIQLSQVNSAQCFQIAQITRFLVNAQMLLALPVLWVRMSQWEVDTSETDVYLGLGGPLPDMPDMPDDQATA